MPHLILTLLVFLNLACLTEPTSQKPNASLSSQASLPRADDAAVNDSQTLQIEKDNPRAVEIMKKDCENGYDVLNLDHTDDKPQAEAGIRMPVNEDGRKAGPVKPFIYYRCRGRSVP